MTPEQSVINRARATLWHLGGEPWSLADWSNAAAGEMGELCNIIKKLRRLETETGGRYNEQNPALLINQACDEIADVVIYLDLLLEQLAPHRRMINIVAVKFNRTSIEFGFNHRMEIQP